MTITALGTAAVLLLAAGCGSGGLDSGLGIDAGPSNVTIELGSGEAMFESIVDGQEIFVVQGFQGGFHVFGSARVSGVHPGDPDNLFDPTNPTTEFQVWSGGTRIDALASSYTQGLRPVDGETDLYEMVGRYIILDIACDWDLVGTAVDFQVTVTDIDGLGAGDSRKMLMVIRHPDNRTMPGCL